MVRWRRPEYNRVTVTAKQPHAPKSSDKTEDVAETIAEVLKVINEGFQIMNRETGSAKEHPYSFILVDGTTRVQFQNLETVDMVQRLDKKEPSVVWVSIDSRIGLARLGVLSKSDWSSGGLHLQIANRCLAHQADCDEDNAHVNEKKTKFPPLVVGSRNTRICRNESVAVEDGDDASRREAIFCVHHRDNQGCGDRFFEEPCGSDLCRT